MFAIRSMRAPGFRRGGMHFSSLAWTLTDQVTDAQRNEPMLEVIEVEGRGDPLLRGFPIVGEDLPAVPAADAATTEEMDALQERYAELEADYTVIQAAHRNLQDLNRDMGANIQSLAADAEALRKENRELSGQVEALTKANDELTSHLATVGEENAALEQPVSELQEQLAAATQEPAQADKADAAPSGPTDSPAAGDGDGRSADITHKPGKGKTQHAAAE